MPRLELNPAGVRSEMLEGLNRSFPGWGGTRAYRWYFHRQVGPRADLLILRGQDGAIAAATGVNYRRVVLGQDGSSQLAGILTSSWTAPEMRGRGLFSRLIEASARRVRERQGALLLAFVTDDNPSRRALAKAGCTLFPSHYLFSTARTPEPRIAPLCTEVEPTPAALETIRARASLERRGYLHFRYERISAWESQFFRRPHPVEILAFEDGARALVEHVPASQTTRAADRVQLLVTGRDPKPALSALLQRALARDRQLFLFTTSNILVEASRKLGLEVKPGRITVRSLGGVRRRIEPLESRRWLLSSGDRM